MLFCHFWKSEKVLCNNHPFMTDFQISYKVLPLTKCFHLEIFDNIKTFLWIFSAFFIFPFFFCLLLFLWLLAATEILKWINISFFFYFFCTLGLFKRYVTPEGGREGSKLCYEPFQKSGGGEGVSVMPLRNVDKFFYIANFMRNLPIGSYSLYYSTSKILVFRWTLF